MTLRGYLSVGPLQQFLIKRTCTLFSHRQADSRCSWDGCQTIAQWPYRNASRSQYQQQAVTKILAEAKRSAVSFKFLLPCQHLFQCCHHSEVQHSGALAIKQDLFQHKASPGLRTALLSIRAIFLTFFSSIARAA